MGLTRVRADQISNIDYKQAVKVITLTNISNLATGAPLIVDGVTLSVGDRVLVTAQGTGSENGIYVVTATGTGSNGSWSRATDANETGDLSAGAIVMVTDGDTYADTSWKLITGDPITIGITSLTFLQNTGNSFNIISTDASNVAANGVSGTVTFTAGNNFSVVGNNASDVITFSVVDAPTFVGNVQASYFIGNGSQLTGLPSGYANSDAVAYGEVGWAGNIIPSANVTYSLGNVTNQWASVYVGANTLYINNVAVSVNSSNTLTVAGANVVTQNANGNISAGNISVSGNVQASYYLGDGSLLTGIAPTVQVYEFANVASGVSTYQEAEWLANYVPSALANASATVTTTPVNIISFITNANYPGITVIPSGTILVRIQTIKNSGPQGYYCYAQIYSRTSGGTETLIATTDNSSIITQNAVVQQNLIAYITTPVSLNITDRIVVKIFAVMISGSATITLSYDDNSGSGLQLPALPASAATYVPYNNATANLALGGFGLTSSFVSATGDVTGGNVYSGGLISGGTANIATLNVSANANIKAVTFGSATQSSINTDGNISTSGTISATGNITGGQLFTSGLISATGNITGSVLNIGSILNTNANGAGNIGNSTNYFNTIFAKATSAQYADLAEKYTADAVYSPGTVLEFGGEKEVTVTSTTHTTKSAGIVSTNPSYLMNSSLDSSFAVELALVGRVPCQVVGTIHKGDRLVSSNIPGVATVLNMELYQPGCIIGKALEDYNSSEVGIIEVAVGRF